MMVMYVDMIITGDKVEISHLNAKMEKGFEVKDLRYLKYFLAIKVATK